MSPRRILVAFDGTEPAFHALEQAADVARATDADIAVVTVLRPETLAAEQARSYLVDQGLEPEVYTPVGDPVTEIRRVADDRGFDTVYLGTRGQGSLARALEGSVSDAVAGTTAITVVIAR